ncbi:hypothetical protein LJC34_05860 [Oscillospiraceae bacterium OttesenSCG-928-G22]|nr:hypothetical protein [Oscillospiraceae bacterium OttesenSCG-928-G22]
MSIKNGNRYTKNLVLGDKFLEDTGNEYRFVSQKPYKGKLEVGLSPGANVTLQIITDNAPPTVDKTTGLTRDNNELETFDATIVGVDYPLPFKKGDPVSLGGFMQEASYYIDFNFILRFKEIKPIRPSQTQGGNNAPTKTT